jgi:hypothetical protein
VAVVTSGPQVLVAALTWRRGRLGDHWVPVTLKVDDGAYRSPPTDSIAGDQDGTSGWARRLGEVGKQLDREPLALRDACLLTVEGGFVVEALVQEPETENWALTSREYAVPSERPR